MSATLLPFNLLFLGQLSMEPVFGWWALIPLATIMLASLWLTLSSDGLSWRGKLCLGSLRLLATLVLLLGWLRPGFVTEIERESEGAIAVLMDRSQSMQFPGETSGQSRWATQREIWNTIVAESDLQIGSLRLVPYFFDRQLQAVDASQLPELREAFSGSPDGRLTDFGKTLSQIGRQQLDPPLRGALLITDGTQTMIPPAVPPSQAARQMAQLDQPLAVIGVGQRGTSDSVKDVAIEGMPEFMTAFVQKEISVPLVIEAIGMQNQPIRVQLALRSGGKPDEVIASREILASRPAEKLPIEFKAQLPKEGEYVLVATAVVDASEQIESNNRALGFVSVREGGVKLLYLEGQPRAEQLFLKRSLNQSIEFEAEYLWFPQKDRPKWPVEIRNDVNLSEYDVFIIGDLDSSALTATTMQGIARRVNQGAGLLMLGGYHSFDAGGYGKTPLDQLIPIDMSGPRQPFDAPVDERLHIQQDVQLQPTRPHPITNLAAEPEHQRKWRALKPLEGINRFRQLKSRPGTQVLLETTDGVPALVTGEAGNGRVLAFAGDTTYRWFLAGDEGGQQQIHKQFWRQAVLWLVGRDTLQEGFRLLLDQRRWEIDSTPRLTAEWFGGSDNNPMPEGVKIELSHDGAWLRNLESNVRDTNHRVAEITGLDTPGLYRATLSAPRPAATEGGTNGGDEGDYTAEVAFIVRDDSRELNQPLPDWQMLANLVSANQAAGGQLFLPEELGEALEFFRQRQAETRVTTVEKRRLGDAAWDAWLFLAIFCVLMSVEWGLRKSWQLP